MRTLVTGAAGYVGSQIVHTLHRTFEQPFVMGVDNLTTGNIGHLPHGVDCVFGEVKSRRFMGNLIRHHKIDRIVHCAASVSVPESVKHPLHYYQNNTVATLNLIETARDCGVKGLVFISTAAVYGNPEFVRPIKEDDAKRPCSPYGWSKLMAEQMLRDSLPLPTVILRLFNVAGADPLWRTGQGPDAPHLLSRAVRAALGKGPALTLYGDGFDKRDYVHVEDVATAVMGALDWTANRAQKFVTLNVGNGRGYRALDVIEAVRQATGKPVPFVPADRREGDPFSIVADTALIQDKLNWLPRYNLNHMVEHALRWEENRK